MPRMKMKRVRSAPVRLPAPKEGEDSFGQVCVDLRRALHTTQPRLAEWFGVSGKTFARWEDRAAFPTKLQVPGILAALATHAPEYTDRASRVLGVEPTPPRPAAPATPATVIASPAVAKVALEGALFEAAERLGLPSGRAREVAVMVLERVALLGLAVGEAAAMIRRGGEPPL